MDIGDVLLASLVRRFQGAAVELDANHAAGVEPLVEVWERSETSPADIPFDVCITLKGYRLLQVKEPQSTSARSSNNVTKFVLAAQPSESLHDDLQSCTSEDVRAKVSQPGALDPDPSCPSCAQLLKNLESVSTSWQEDQQEKALVKKQLKAADQQIQSHSLAVAKMARKLEAVTEQFLTEEEQLKNHHARQLAAAMLRVRVAEDSEVEAIAKLNQMQRRLADLSTELGMAKRQIQALTQDGASLYRDVAKARAAAMRASLDGRISKGSLGLLGLDVDLSNGPHSALTPLSSVGDEYSDLPVLSPSQKPGPTSPWRQATQLQDSKNLEPIVEPRAPTLEVPRPAAEAARQARAKFWGFAKGGGAKEAQPVAENGEFVADRRRSLSGRARRSLELGMGTGGTPEGSQATGAAVVRRTRSVDMFSSFRHAPEHLDRAGASVAAAITSVADKVVQTGRKSFQAVARMTSSKSETNLAAKAEEPAPAAASPPASPAGVSQATGQPATAPTFPAPAPHAAAGKQAYQLVSGSGDSDAVVTIKQTPAAPQGCGCVIA